MVESEVLSNGDFYTSLKVYIIIPVHNRREITLRCLQNLRDIGDLDRYHVVVVDDGSTDGTSQAILEYFPQVHIIYGDGNLWWTGAIRKGMMYSRGQGANYYVWLNDDNLPLKGSINRLINTALNNPDKIVGGQALDPETHIPSYAGICKFIFHTESVNAMKGQLISCDGLNGNLVCIPNNVVNVIGFPDSKKFPHYHGDSTYTHQAKSKGFSLLICGDAITYGRFTEPPVTSTSKGHSLRDLLNDRFCIKSPYYLRSHLGFYTEFFGIYGIFIYIHHMIIRFFGKAILARAPNIGVTKHPMH